MSFCPFRFLLRKRKSKQKKPEYLPLFTPFSVSASCDPDIRTLAKLADGIGCTFDCLVGRDR